MTPRAQARLADIALFGVFATGAALVLLLQLQRPAAVPSRCATDGLFAAPKVGLRAEMRRHLPQAEASR